MMLTSIRLNSLLKKYVCNRSVVRSYNVWTSDLVVKSPYENVIIPDLTIVDFVWRNLEKWPTKTAVVCGVTNRSYTYEQMYKQSQVLAANLRKKLKIQNGDIIGVMSQNSPEYPIVAFGVLAAGAVMTTLNPIYTAYEVQRQIELSDVKVMIAHIDVIPVVKEALRMAKKNIPIIAINVNKSTSENIISYMELVEDNVNVDLNVLKEVNRKPEDLAILPYSSGTTGLPKGVELTNKNFVANCKQQDSELRQYRHTTENEQDVAMAVLPLFHSYGLSIIMLHKLAVGLKLVTLPKFQPDTFLNALIRYRINILYVAPPMVLFMGSNEHITPKHFDSLRIVTSGAAPLPRADIEKMLSRTKGTDVFFCQGYGLTEASPLVSLSETGSKNYESVGCAIPNVELKVVDSKMKSLGPGQAGELVIRGPNIMKGYRNNTEANKEVFLEGGWYRSGDVAYIDESGYVYITDRLKELIKVKGFQVPPAELENVLKEHPAVHDAAVIGIPDNTTGERPKAFVVLKANANITDRDIIEYVAKRVAPYKKIKDIVFVESIPKNAAGKILRRLLRSNP